MSNTLPLTDPPAAPLWSKMLPLDQMSPVTVVIELPWKVSELLPPGQPSGLNVRIAVPFVSALRATAVAVAPTRMVGPEPSTCITVTGTWCTAVAVKVTPAREWSAATTVST